MIILINLIGIALIFFIIWWFWIYTPHEVILAEEDIVEVIVDNGIYKPDTIKTAVGKILTLRFLRKDPSPCAGTVVFPDFDISSELPIEKAHDVIITPDEAGEFEFTCQMGMYRGKLIVE